MFKKTFIIAEAGVNHDGSLKKAYKLIDAAKEANADAIKFQTWKTEKVVIKKSIKAPYQNKYFKDHTQFEMLKKLELNFESFIKIKKYCDKKNIVFLSTADEIESAKFLKPLIKYIKIGSAEINDFPFLKKLAKFKKPIFLSSGMSNINEIKKAVKIITSNGLNKDKICVLHCNTAYPTPFKDANLNAIKTIKNKLNISVGYSDHTPSIEASIAAVTLGAEIIEKHFTINSSDQGPDHSSSLEPDKFYEMVSSIRNVEKALGDGVKKLSQSEKKNIKSTRKSIVANKKIKKGSKFNKNNITIKRPGTGISPTLYYEILGKIAKRDYSVDDFIKNE
tara:strand:+ start:11959 stop:12963 length:1005 start_codon:yes stop_codon:yes gene_type:complete